MICKNCGTDIKANGSKCPTCGKAVPDGVEPDKESVLYSNNYVSPFVPKSSYMGLLPSAGKKTSKYLAPAIALGIILLAVLIGFILSPFS